ncbi:MAG: DUF1963 domain-containing protein [Clostridiales bacterium]|nr:DUF1963 domain-containing protein [Clostridiales bacterium]
MDNISTLIESMARNSVRLTIDGAATSHSYFGGEPELPRGFEFPKFECATYEDDEVKPRYLAFIAQIDCAEASKFDTDGLLPTHGILSFFYEIESMCWGFDPNDADSSRVFYFENTDELVTTPLPDGICEYAHFPKLGISFKSELSLPDYSDFITKHRDLDCCDVYDERRAELGWDYPDNIHKLLGWADIIQDNMTLECELVTRGYYLGNPDGWKKVKPEDRKYADEHSIDEWVLLFQLDTVESDGFELMFGDCGRLYYCIRRDDLIAKRFDKCWLISQCC